MKKVIGIIEIASNSLRLKIGERSPKGVKTIEAVTYPLALGKDTFHNGSISFESLDKAADIIKGFLNITKDYGVTQTYAVATTAIREAKNREYILDQLKLKTGLELQVMDESQEKLNISKVIYASMDESRKDSTILIHLGSGNVSISLIEKGEITATKNIKIGALRISELFDETIDDSADYVQIIKEYIYPFSDSIANIIQNKTAHFIISGNETEKISELCKAKIKDKNYIIDRDAFTKLYQGFKNSTPTALANEYDMPYEDAESLLSTIIIISRLLKFTNAKHIVSSMLSLGDALLYSALYPAEEKNLTKVYAGFSIKDAVKIAERFNTDIDHINRVSETALKIFDRMKKVHGMKNREKLLLQLAAILQDVGKFVNNKGHNVLSYHMIKGMDIIGITENDLAIVSAIVLFHNTMDPNTEHEEYANLDPNSRMIAAKLCAILRLANAVHYAHNAKFNDVSVRLSGKELIITVSTYKNINLEKWTFKSKSRLFAEVYGVIPVLNKRSVM